jgi:hypothetical protein
MARNAKEARRNLDAAINRFGGLTKVAASSGVSEQTVRNWKAAGNLNKADAVNAFRFSRAIGEPLERFLILSEE